MQGFFLNLPTVISHPPPSPPARTRLPPAPTLDKTSDDGELGGGSAGGRWSDGDAGGCSDDGGGTGDGDEDHDEGNESDYV